MSILFVFATKHTSSITFCKFVFWFWLFFLWSYFLTPFVCRVHRLLLTKYLGGHAGVVAVLKEKSEQYVKWPQPFCCFPRAHLGSTFLWAIKRGTMQYVFISPVVSFSAVILAAFGKYGDGVIDWEEGYVYVMIIQNFTQLMALYCLVWFYVVVGEDLKPFHPLAKFIVVKSVVFFTFWQGVGINLFVKLGWIQDESDLSANEVQLALQDFIICVEMFIAAAAHRYTFGHEMFQDGSFFTMMEECKVRTLRANVQPDKDEDAFYDLDAEGHMDPSAIGRIQHGMAQLLKPVVSEVDDFIGVIPKSHRDMVTPHHDHDEELGPPPEEYVRPNQAASSASHAPSHKEAPHASKAHVSASQSHAHGGFHRPATREPTNPVPVKKPDDDPDLS